MVLVLGSGLALLMVALAAIVVVQYRKVGPNEVLIVSGRPSDYIDPISGDTYAKTFSIHHGGGTFVLPLRERADVMSVELMTLKIATPDLYTKLGIPIAVDAIAQIKVRSDDPLSVATAAEMFLSKSTKEMNAIAHQMMQGHLRAVISTMPFEEIHANPEAFAQTVQRLTAADLANMGIQVVSFTIREVRDPSGYMLALGRPQVAEAQKCAQLGEAHAHRDATVGKALAERQAATTASEAKQIARKAAIDAEVAVASAEAKRDLEVHKLAARVAQARAGEELAYELERAAAESELAERQVALKELWVKRREQELHAEVDKPAEAERRRIEQLALAEQRRRQLQSECAANEIRLRGLAEAEVMRAQREAVAEGMRLEQLAQAEGLRARLMAEADGMREKAEAYKQYSSAALGEQLIGKLPEVAAAVAAPLAGVDRIVLMGGNGDSQMGKLTQGVVDVMTKVPPFVEAATGIDLRRLMSEAGALASTEPASAPPEEEPPPQSLLPEEGAAQGSAAAAPAAAE